MKVRRNPDAKMDLENVKALKVNYSINLCRFVYSSQSSSNRRFHAAIHEIGLLGRDTSVTKVKLQRAQD